MKKKEKELKKFPKMKEEKSEKGDSPHTESGEHLKHPQVKPINQHKLVNDTAYFLHHPQIKPHGPNFPPKKPRG